MSDIIVNTGPGSRISSSWTKDELAQSNISNNSSTFARRRDDHIERHENRPLNSTSSSSVSSEGCSSEEESSASEGESEDDFSLDSEEDGDSESEQSASVDHETGPNEAEPIEELSKPGAATQPLLERPSLKHTINIFKKRKATDENIEHQPRTRRRVESGKRKTHAGLTPTTDGLPKTAQVTKRSEQVTESAADLRKRLDAFLPRLREANAALSATQDRPIDQGLIAQDLRDTSSEDADSGDEEGESTKERGPYIEMNLGLGVLSQKNSGASNEVRIRPEEGTDDEEVLNGTDDTRETGLSKNLVGRLLGKKDKGPTGKHRGIQEV